MTWSEIVLLTVLLLALGVWLMWVSASRLDRLHRKVVASRLALQAQLERRARTAIDLAAAGMLDPASSVLVADAAYAALQSVSVPEAASPAQAFDLTGLTGDRERAESGLTVTLRSVLTEADTVTALRESSGGAEILDELQAVWYRAQLARRFHNEAVAQAQRARRHRAVRWLRLAGHAPLPRTVELDDQMPAGLGQP